MNRLTAAILTLMACAQLTHAQDVHFSQFFATPMFTNPAFAGHFKGTYRFSGIIRNQWASVSPQPYQTFGGGVDINAPLNISPMGVGINLMHDVAGLSSLSHTQAQVFLSGKVHFGNAKSFCVGAGMMGSATQQHIDFSRLTFDDQHNGIRFDPNIITGETPPMEAVNYLGMSGGVFLERKWSERRRLLLGYALFNINEPNRSFYKNRSDNLARRHNLHLTSSLQLGAKWDFMPALQWMRQGRQSELLGGFAFRYHLSTEVVNPRSLQVGLWGRPGDAANLSAGMQMGNLYVGGAYDVNFSSLQPASNYRGAWEVAVIYTLATVRDKVKRLRQCPDYL